MITLLVSKRNNVHIYITNLCQFKCWRYWNCAPPDPLLFANIMLIIFQIFSQSLINANLFYVWDRPLLDIDTILIF